MDFYNIILEKQDSLYCNNLIFKKFSLGLLSFNQHKWFTILNAVILWIICVLYIVLGVVFFNEERAQTGTPNQAPPQPSREIKVDIKENAEKV